LGHSNFNYAPKIFQIVGEVGVPPKKIKEMRIFRLKWLKSRACQRAKYLIKKLIFWD
jgi:ribosomal protein L30/L7E